MDSIAMRDVPSHVDLSCDSYFTHYTRFLHVSTRYTERFEVADRIVSRMLRVSPCKRKFYAQIESVVLERKVSHFRAFN